MKIFSTAVAAAAIYAMMTSLAAAQAPSVSVSISKSAVPEGGRFYVTISRSGNLAQSSWVNWAVTGPVDAVDFNRTRLPGGTASFASGQARKGFWLTTFDDTTVEPDETFDIVLSSPRNAVIANGAVSATILNNDIATRSPMTLINPSHPDVWAREDAFIDHMRVAGMRLSQWVANGNFDPATQRFVKTDPNGKLTIGPVRGGYVPGAGDFYKGKWVLDWQGDGDLSVIGGAGTQTRVSANRLEEDYDPALHGRNSPVVRIDRIGPGGVWNIRFYRAQHEALLNGGEVFDPRWLNDVARFDVIRPMDWTGVNGDYELFAADRPPANRQFYNSGRVPDAVIVRAAIEAGVELWLNAPGLLGCPPAAAAVLRDKTLPVSQRVAAARGAFDQIMASSEPLSWARRIVAELNSQGYPVTRRILVELDNEVWNTNFHASTNLHKGIGEEIAARRPELSLASSPSTGYGYRSAQYAAAFAQALAEGGRPQQVWTMVLGGQTVFVQRTKVALAGVSAFGGPEPMSRYGVATTNYIWGGFRWDSESTLFGAPLDRPTWRQKWQAELAADPAALRQRITDYILAPTQERGNVAFLAQNMRDHKAAAEAAGARWIGNFEGDSQDALDPGLAQDPAAVALFHEWHESADHGREISAIAQEIRTIDPTAIMANYVFCAARRTPHHPWTECTPWDQSGGDNAAWDALLKP